MKLSRRRLLSALTAIPAVRSLVAQQQTPGETNPTFSSSVKVVNVFATVRDKKGQIVRGLTQNDFALEEEGRPQVIRYFSAESDLPLTLGLLVDTSGSQRGVIEEERSASYRFFDQILREDRDQAFVIYFDFEVVLLEDLTSSRRRLQAALQRLEVQDQRLQRRQPGSSTRGPRRGGTNLYDSILLAADELTSKQKGRKALVLLTDGVDTGSRTTIREAIDAALKADTLVYGILFAENEGGRPRILFGGRPMGGRGVIDLPDGKKVLKQITRETGGRFFEVSRKQPIDKVFAEIEEDLRNQYNIGYSPDTKGADAETYRRIQLTTKKKDFVVTAREGYYPS